MRCELRVHSVGVDLRSTRAVQAANDRRADEDIRPHRCVQISGSFHWKAQIPQEAAEKHQDGRCPAPGRTAKESERHPGRNRIDLHLETENLPKKGVQAKPDGHRGSQGDSYYDSPAGKFHPGLGGGVQMKDQPHGLHGRPAKKQHCHRREHHIQQEVESPVSMALDCLLRERCEHNLQNRQ